MVIKTFLVEKSYISRTMLARLLSGYNAGGDSIEIVGETETIRGAALMLGDADPDLLIILPDNTSEKDIENFISNAKKQKPSVKIIYVAYPNEKNTVVSAWEYGADNFFIKPYKAGKVFGVIEEIFKSGGNS